MHRTVAVILGGGRGQRLLPLTRDRAKPAVPLAGEYRLIDIPVSNCLNSGLHRIYVLTQFNTVSLHRHINHTYKFDDFGERFVEILAAQQTGQGEQWYQGTADAVRQNLPHMRLHSADRCLILSGDQLYRMDFRRMLHRHTQAKAAVTLAVLPVSRDQARSLGVVRLGPEGAICEFCEKPQDDATLDRFAAPPEMLRAAGIEPAGRTHLASMGIYLFNTDTLDAALSRDDAEDFGKQVIPRTIRECEGCVAAYLFDGYWEDIGTTGAFFEANLNLTDPVPQFDFFDEDNPVWTHPRHLPASKLNRCDAERVILGDGCIVDRSRLRRCVIGLRSVVREGCELENVVMMGADFFETSEHRRRHATEGVPPLGLGRNVRVRNAIIDKNARVGDDVVLENRAGERERDGPDYWVREGIIIVPRSGIIPPGTVL